MKGLIFGGEGEGVVVVNSSKQTDCSKCYVNAGSVQSDQSSKYIKQKIRKLN